MTTYRKGADPEALTRIARSIAGMQEELTRIESTSRSVMGTIRGNWGGDNLLSLVDTFTTSCLPGLRACSGVLDAMARRLDDNVAAQRGASGEGGAGGPGGGGGLNDVTKTKGKKHDANPFRDFTHGWKDTEHGEHERSSAFGFTKDSHTRTVRDSLEKTQWSVRDGEGNEIGHGFGIKGDGEHEWGRRLSLPHDGSDDPNRFEARHEKAAGLLGGALGGVSWTHKDENVRTDYAKTYYDAYGNVTDAALADRAAYGGTLGTETKHHTEVGIKDGALFAGAGAGAGAYLLRGGVEGNLGQHGKYDASGFVGAEAKADAGITLGKDGLQAKAGAEAFAGAKGEAGVSYDNGPLAGHVGANAMAGAEAKADASLGIGKDGVTAHAGANAFAGAKAAAEVGGSIAGIGGTVGGEVYAGIGGHANVDAVFSAEKVKVNVDVGAAVGVGAGVKFGVDVQPKELMDDVGHGLGGAGSAIDSGFKHGADSIGRVFGW